MLIIVTDDGHPPRQFDDPKTAHRYASDPASFRAEENRKAAISYRRQERLRARIERICAYPAYRQDFGSERSEPDGGETDHFHCIGSGKPDLTGTITMDSDGNVFLGDIVKSRSRNAEDIGKDTFTPVPHAPK